MHVCHILRQRLASHSLIRFSNVFNSVVPRSCTYLCMSIQLCNYTLIMQLQSYVHSRKQYIIHCMQWHFCRRQQLQFWSLDQIRVMGSELPVRPCTQWWDCWSMASRRGYCNDAFHREEWWCFWYLLVPLLCWFLHHDLSDGRRIAKREGIEYRYLQTCSVNPGPSRRWLQMRISMVGCIDCWRRTEIESDCVRELGSCTLFTISKSDKCCWRGISIFSSNIRFYSNLWWLSKPVKRVP